MFSVVYASSKGLAVVEGGGGEASCLVVKQAVEFPQVLAVINKLLLK